MASAKRHSGGSMATKRKPGGKLNAVRDGIFAKNVVILSAGENQQEYDRLRSQLLNDYRPLTTTEQMLVEDLVNNLWRRLRVRRCEAAAIRQQIESAAIRKRLAELGELEVFKDRFLEARSRLHFETNLPAEDQLNLEHSVAEARRDLERTPAGLEFLVDNLRAVKNCLRVIGYLPEHLERLLIHVCGFEAGQRFVQLNQIAKKARQQPHGPEKQPGTNDGNGADKNNRTDHDPMMRAALIRFGQKGTEQLTKEQSQGGGTSPREQMGVPTAAEMLHHLRDMDHGTAGFLKNFLHSVVPILEREGCKLQSEENTAETGVDPNLGNERYESTRRLHNFLRYELEESERLEAEWAELDKENIGGESAVVSPEEFFLAQAIDMHIESLKRKKLELERLAKIEEEGALECSLLLPPPLQDRIHRAEAALDRRIYKTLQLLSQENG